MQFTNHCNTLGKWSDIGWTAVERSEDCGLSSAGHVLTRCPDRDECAGVTHLVASSSHPGGLNSMQSVPFPKARAVIDKVSPAKALLALGGGVTTRGAPVPRQLHNERCTGPRRRHNERRTPKKTKNSLPTKTQLT